MGLLDIAQLDASSGLLGAFKPAADEGLLTRILGTNDPRDPRSGAAMALASGLMRGSFADGVAGYQRALAEGDERNQRRVQNNLMTAKQSMELAEIQRRIREDAEFRDVMAKHYQNRQLGGVQAAGGQPAEGGVGMYQGAGDVPAQSSPRVNAYQNYLAIGEELARKGQAARAQQYFDLAEKWRPKFSTTPQTMTDRASGQVGNYLIGEDGTVLPLSQGVKPDIHFEDLGGKKQAIDRNRVQAGTIYDKTLTPGEVASNEVARGNLAVSQGQLGLARQRFALDAAEKDRPVLQDGQWYVRPSASNPQGGVITPEGTTPKLTEFQGKSTTYATRMRDATGVLDKLEGQAWPSTVNRAGYQAEMPRWLPGGQMAGAAATGLNNMTVPAAAQQLHQAQENWVTANLRQESGAAIGVSEMAQEKKKWFPQPGDGPDVIMQKANARRVAEEAMMAQAGPGAKMIPGVLQRAASANEQRNAGRQSNAEVQQLPSTVVPKNLKVGNLYQLPNGKVGRWDGFNFKEQIQ